MNPKTQAWVYTTNVALSIDIVQDLAPAAHFPRADAAQKAADGGDCGGVLWMKKRGYSSECRSCSRSVECRPFGPWVFLRVFGEKGYDGVSFSSRKELIERREKPSSHQDPDPKEVVVSEVGTFFD